MINEVVDNAITSAFRALVQTIEEGGEVLGINIGIKYKNSDGKERAASALLVNKDGVTETGHNPVVDSLRKEFNKLEEKLMLKAGEYRQNPGDTFISAEVRSRVNPSTGKVATFNNLDEERNWIRVRPSRSSTGISQYRSGLGRSDSDEGVEDYGW